MRRVYVKRPSLASRVELHRRRLDGVSAEEGRKAWKRFRGSVKSREVVEILKKAAGKRGRCFYCSDSLGADIDHFVPISVTVNKTFDWRNFVWVCPVCNRLKGDRFPLDAAGFALLINPTIEDPWEYLILDIDTGVLAPRYNQGMFDVKAEATLKVIPSITYEAAEEGRSRSVRRIREAVKRIPDSSQPLDEELRELFRAVREDDYGVASWFALWEGRNEADMVDLRRRNPQAWNRFVAAAQSARYGQLC